MGLDVVLENGSKLGKLVGMPNYGAGDLLEVAVDGNSETVLIPFTNAFVPQDDFTNGKIIVNLPEAIWMQSNALPNSVIPAKRNPWMFEIGFRRMTRGGWGGD